jgi:O-6-methylguanine DNA methyltransferase
MRRRKYAEKSELIWSRCTTGQREVHIVTKDGALYGVFPESGEASDMVAVCRRWYSNCKLITGPVPIAIEQELSAYFAGDTAKLRVTIPAEAGTDFQRRIWTLLRKIPRGKVWSYSRLAAEAGCPTAARAVGAAVGANPLSIYLPCHRVVGASGAMTGYAWGLEWKRHLLMLEGVTVTALGHQLSVPHRFFDGIDSFRGVG